MITTVSAPRFETSVFINCPFDSGYKRLLSAIVFAVTDLGFNVRLARERDDSSENRLSKIADLIRNSKYGIHDLSRSDPNSPRLPRFNMPLELGMFLGCKEFGQKKQTAKVALILDKEPFRYLESTSDLRGVDIKYHHNKYANAIVAVREWLAPSPERTKQHGAEEIKRRFKLFNDELPGLCAKLKVKPRELTLPELSALMNAFVFEIDQ